MRKSRAPISFAIDWKAPPITRMSTDVASAGPDSPVSLARVQSTTMLPCRSISAASPGGITVVESYCSTIAGPAIDSPALSPERS